MSAWFFHDDQGWQDVDAYAGPGVYLLDPADRQMAAVLDAALGAELPQLALPVQPGRRPPRLVLDAHGVLALRLHMVFPRREPELRRSEEELLQTRLVWARDHLVLVAPQQHWRRIVRDSLELDPHAPQDKVLQRILLTAIYSHDSATQRIVAELRELRNALRSSLNNREMRRIVVLNRRLGELVVSIRDLGLTLRSLRAELGDADPLRDRIDEIYDEQRRIEEILTLIWDRYLGVTNAYAGIIQNNAHTIMKVMTAYLAFLMVPIALIMPFHMNTVLPMEHFHYAWYVLLLYSFGTSGWFFFQWGRKRGFFHL